MWEGNVFSHVCSQGRSYVTTSYDAIGQSPVTLESPSHLLGNGRLVFDLNAFPLKIFLVVTRNFALKHWSLIKLFWSSKGWGCPPAQQCDRKEEVLLFILNASVPFSVIYYLDSWSSLPFWPSTQPSWIRRYHPPLDGDRWTQSQHNLEQFYIQCQRQRCDTVLIENNGVAPEWVAILFWSDFIVFNENSIASIIAELTLTSV